MTVSVLAYENSYFLVNGKILEEIFLDFDEMRGREGGLGLIGLIGQLGLL